MLSAMHTWSLTAIAVVAGIAMLWVFGRFSNRERAAYAKRQARAQLYAMRLFASEPALILRAQKQLLIWNARYLALLLPPVAIMIIPSILLFTALENLYGKRPIEPGESAIVCARFRDGVDLHELQPGARKHSQKARLHRRDCGGPPSRSGRSLLASARGWPSVPQRARFAAGPRAEDRSGVPGGLPQCCRIPHKLARLVRGDLPAHHARRLPPGHPGVAPVTFTPVCNILY